jgi:hypothetical protein
MEKPFEQSKLIKTHQKDLQSGLAAFEVSLLKSSKGVFGCQA